MDTPSNGSSILSQGALIIAAPLEGVYDLRVQAVVPTKSRLQGANRSRSGATARICNAADGGFVGAIRPHTEIVNTLLSSKDPPTLHLPDMPASTTLLPAPACSPELSCDVVIVGAGPAGLALAIALAQAGFRVTVLERQSTDVLDNPPPDGREIALTHPSVACLQRLGSWRHLAGHETGTIVQAQVHDGPLGWRSPLQLDASAEGVAHLGWIVPNYALRRSAWQVARHMDGLGVITEARDVRAQVMPDHVQVHYTMGGAVHRVQAALLVAADSRFSSLRAQLGIGASLHDFGRTVIVCRLRHERPHHATAHECFGYARTLAILPLPDDPEDGAPLCSAVITADTPQAQTLLALPPAQFSALVQEQFDNRLGRMQLVGERHAYPLVAVYAHRFVQARCALLGDAAVGMHPVTAHGYNLGLSGVQTLTHTLKRARARGSDIGSERVLARYGQAHHSHAWPIYQGTNAIVRLYTDTRALSKLLRRTVLAASMRLPPLKSAIVRQLVGQRAGAEV